MHTLQFYIYTRSKCALFPLGRSNENQIFPTVEKLLRKWWWSNIVLNFDWISLNTMLSLPKIGFIKSIQLFFNFKLILVARLLLLVETFDIWVFNWDPKKFLRKRNWQNWLIFLGKRKSDWKTLESQYSKKKQILAYILLDVLFYIRQLAADTRVRYDGLTRTN